jgi:hypothetical protein
MPPKYGGNPAYLKNLEEIKTLTEAMNQRPERKGDGSLIERRKEIQAEIDAVKKDLSLRSLIDASQTRIKELNRQYDTLNQELATWERKEFLLKNFEFARNEKYEEVVNRMFRLVKFTLFKTQVDGQIVPNCECLVDGVPYSTQNRAMQVAMGLDIVSAIGERKGVIAPIFIDNRESVTDIPEVPAQVINLVVDPNEKELRII